ncbi:TetR/AcrR family transcriptional regulator [Methanoregula sp.]|uniref:TetR/AcrR family transcriptional regulator n=1 Tax=Methanoregula sp. TaxID=2052170 RepID=UPI002C6BB4AC|nr:TetR/AcrR family transcriptional regulator [Methanoregula sp.]HVP96106.1 TetR/AcrR family transcriptional regulator [Methanoregula sp.]
MKPMEPALEKRDAILATALVLFCERGFFGTPTSLISREAGVATGTLFFYFPTKEDLIDTLYRQVKGEAAAALKAGVENEPSVKQKLCRVWENAIAWAAENPAKFRFMEQFAHSPFVSSTAHEEGMSHFLFLLDLVRDGIREGIIRDYDPILLCSLLAASLSGLTPRILAEKDPEKKEFLTRQGLTFLWNGLAAGPGAKEPCASLERTIKKKRSPRP